MVLPVQLRYTECGYANSALTALHDHQFDALEKFSPTSTRFRAARITYVLSINASADTRLIVIEKNKKKTS